MRTLVTVLVLLCVSGCAGVPITTQVNEMWNPKDGSQPPPEFKFDLKLIPEIAPEAIAKMDGTQLMEAYKAAFSAGKSAIGLGGSLAFSPHLVFEQHIGADTTTTADQQFKSTLDAAITLRDFINGPLSGGTD